MFSRLQIQKDQITVSVGCKNIPRFINRKAERKILLKNLSGSAAFPNQEKADAFSAAQKEKREAAKAATMEGPTSTADGGEGCGEVTA